MGFTFFLNTFQSKISLLNSVWPSYLGSSIIICTCKCETTILRIYCAVANVKSFLICFRLCRSGSPSGTIALSLYDFFSQFIKLGKTVEVEVKYYRVHICWHQLIFIVPTVRTSGKDVTQLDKFTQKGGLGSRRDWFELILLLTSNFTSLGRKEIVEKAAMKWICNRLKYCGLGSLLLVGASKDWSCVTGAVLLGDAFSCKSAALLEILKVDLSVNQVRWCVCHSGPGYRESPCNGLTLPQGNERLFMCR